MYPGFYQHAKKILEEAKRKSRFLYWCKDCRKQFELPIGQEQGLCDCGTMAVRECDCGGEQSGHVPNGPYCRKGL